MTHATPDHRRRARGGLLLLALAVPLLLPWGAPAAQAASLDGMLSLGNYEIGGFVLADGSLAYCLEPGAEAPLSTQREAVRLAELPGYAVTVNDAWGWSGEVRTSPASGEKLRQINWLLAEHGATKDPDRAAAVQIALWEIRREPGNAGWIEGKYRLFRDNGGASHIAAGKQLAVEAKTAALGPGNAFPDGSLEIEHGDTPGSGSVSYPRGTTQLTIEGGRFDNDTATLLISDGQAGVAEWTATPHEPEWRRYADVTISGEWSVAERFWPAEITVHPSTRGVEQRLGAGVRPTTGKNSGGFEPVRLSADRRFAPAITTQVPEEIVDRAGGTFRDRVSVSAAEAEWPTRFDGAEWLPLTAEGTLFGPFLAPQPESLDAPDDAPVAASSTLEIDAGPGDYDVELAIPEAQAGYYYWLWEIREAHQSDAVRASEILPEGSRFADRFGVLTERQLVPTELRWETELVQRELTPRARELDDRVRASTTGGGWIQDETGARLPANLRLTYYQLDERPQRQETVPEEARELGVVALSLREPEVWIDAPTFTVPAGETGWVTVRACLVAEDQAPETVGKITEWCDDFGVPEETAQIIVDLAETGGATPGERRAVTPLLGLAAGLLSLGGVCAGAGSLRTRARRTGTELN